MEFIPKERSAEAAPSDITVSHILAMCLRAFGPAAALLSARELSGGAFNTTFLVSLDYQQFHTAFLQAYGSQEMFPESLFRIRV